jgi:hypothetical protein
MQFHRGARVASTGADADGDSVVDVSGLVDQALLWQNLKTRNDDTDFIGRGTFGGMAFKVRAVRRTNRSGRAETVLYSAEGCAAADAAAMIAALRDAYRLTLLALAAAYMLGLVMLVGVLSRPSGRQSRQPTPRRPGS